LDYCPALLFFEGFLHLAENPLNLPGCRFNDALGFQTAIIRKLPGCLLDLTLHFVKLAFDLICGAWLHHDGSFGRIQIRSPIAIHGESANSSLLERMMRQLPPLSCCRCLLSTFLSFKLSRAPARYIYIPG